MDSFTLNKIAGAILMVVLLTMGVGIVSDIIFEPIKAEKPGYVVEVAGDGHGGGAAVAKEEKVVAPIGERLASASADAGAKVFKKCAACHDVTDGGPNKVGPNLWGVVGRKPAGHEGFSYSSAMTEFGASHDTWTFEELDHFLTKPKDYVKGTAMGFAGLRKPDDRANLIAYLNDQSSNPVPLPGQ